MTGCPACGSERLKGAPLLLVSAVASPVVHRRRYQCSSCDWKGWKHRLQRRRGVSSGTAKQKTLSDRRAVSLALGVIAFVVLVAALLLRSCEPAHPAMDGGTAGAYGAGPLRDARAGARAKDNHQITQFRNHQIPQAVFFLQQPALERRTRGS